MSKSFWFVAIVALSPVVLKAQGTIPVDPVYRRAQVLVNDGNAAAGRALVDSMITAATPGSNEYAEGLYWRAVFAATAADAEMDYRRVVVDFPGSPRVEDALIRLAQLEIARANYDGALKHLTRLTTGHPDSPARARAGYWTARALFDKNDLQGGCAATADALARTTDADAELRNQINYLNQRCAGVVLTSPTLPAAGAVQPSPAPVTAAPSPTSVPASAPVVVPPAAAPAAAPTAVPPAADSVKTTPQKAAVTVPDERKPAEVPKTTPRPPAPEPEAPKTTTASKKVYSVQVAAYNVKSQAEAMVAKLKKSGYEARVDGTVAPFRVRIGEYATQSQAGAVQRSLKAKQITGFVVQAELR